MANDDKTRIAREVDDYMANVLKLRTPGEVEMIALHLEGYALLWGHAKLTLNDGRWPDRFRWDLERGKLYGHLTADSGEVEL